MHAHLDLGWDSIGSIWKNGIWTRSCDFRGLTPVTLGDLFCDL